ncbi:minichromosome maintenance domain-containing protein 2 [Boleophthalmus pectinirostris]|uniref:minichromosome maintenance domain-containing protein 2 n=1 Tax=Boleophthalmus pectinirostris TaxID=150288 RepID=UPI00242A8C09|nr:minichromosome maintenance domain-containing protein 2 [Boleophthalmus pectinirostris]
MSELDIFSLRESVLVYLDRSGGLEKLSEDCKQYNDQQQDVAVYRFCICVNPSDVIEVDPELGDFVLHDPLKATKLFQSVCYLAIKTLTLLDKIHTENQINTILRFTHLPPFPEYTLDLCTFPRGNVLLKPVFVEGLVIALTRVTKYTQGARFLCMNDDCTCSSGYRHIRVHAPGATESATVRKDFSCKVCNSQLKEDMKFRVLGDKQLVKLVPYKALDLLRGPQQTSLRYQSVTLFLRDELCNSMGIGQTYTVLGIPAHVHQWPHITWSIEANNIQLWEPECSSKVSAKFLELQKTTACSPWRFSAIAAHCFGSDITPPGLYNSLKLCLLLSLVQTTSDSKEMFHNLDILVCTNDSLILDRLMTYSLGLAKRGVRHQSSGEMFASLSRDEHGAGTADIHAGSALLATGGICMLGELGCYKKDKLEAIQTVLEGRTVSVFIPGKKYGEDADQQLSFPLRCSFWALIDTADASRRSNRTECALLGTADLEPVQMKLADAFGLVIQCRDVGEQGLLCHTAHALQHAVQLGACLYTSCMTFSTQDYQELVAQARMLQVELSPRAEKIIHGYYMASRRVRTQTQGVKMSVASIRLLISLAEAHCKLSLRTQVLEEDAIIAVLLCENSVTLKHGTSPLVLLPDALFPCDVTDCDSLHRRDLMLDELHQNILRFIYAYAPGADSYITEE